VAGRAGLDGTSAGVKDAAELTREVVFSPVRGSGVVDQTVRRLGEAIEFGLLEAGEQLPSEMDLAARLQVSLMTLREALAALRAAGYLETRRGRFGGTFIAESASMKLSAAQQMLPEITIEQLRDLLDYRETIAIGTATFACERAQQDDIDLLAALIEQMRAADDYEAWRRVDGRFHITIAAAAKSPRLIAAESQIQAELGPILGLNARNPRVLKAIDGQHVGIMQAIAANDTDAALDAVRSHVRNTAETIISLSLARERTAARSPGA
jgi:DNA-binding FadR family transcriptional regulator